MSVKITVSDDTLNRMRNYFEAREYYTDDWMNVIDLLLTEVGF